MFSERVKQVSHKNVLVTKLGHERVTKWVMKCSERVTKIQEGLRNPSPRPPPV